jgi:hypothetical protein
LKHSGRACDHDYSAPQLRSVPFSRAQSGLLRARNGRPTGDIAQDREGERHADGIYKALVADGVLRIPLEARS